MYRWGALKKLVPLTAYQSLRTVEGLRAGRSGARETAPVVPVDWATVLAALPYMSLQVAAMLQVQYFAGMRPGEVLIMRTCDLDTRARILAVYAGIGYRPLRPPQKMPGGTRLVASYSF